MQKWPFVFSYQLVTKGYLSLLQQIRTINAPKEITTKGRLTTESPFIHLYHNYSASANNCSMLKKVSSIGPILPFRSSSSANAIDSNNSICAFNLL